MQALAAVLGGTQSLHTNGYDEAIGLPTEEAARIALRTQQIIGYESGVVDTPDPLAGSYFVESLTDEVERRAWEYIERIDAMGGAVAAIEAGYQMDEIEQAAYEYTKSIDDGERVIVGLNRFRLDDEPEPVPFPIDPALEAGQRERLAAFKADRDADAVARPPRRRPRRGPRHAEPALPDEGGAARQRHPRRGQRRPARRVRRLPAVGAQTSHASRSAGAWRPGRVSENGGDVVGRCRRRGPARRARGRTTTRT